MQSHDITWSHGKKGLHNMWSHDTKGLHNMQSHDKKGLHNMQSHDRKGYTTCSHMTQRGYIRVARHGHMTNLSRAGLLTGKGLPTPDIYSLPSTPSHTQQDSSDCLGAGPESLSVCCCWSAKGQVNIMGVPQ